MRKEFSRLVSSMSDGAFPIRIVRYGNNKGNAGMHKIINIQIAIRRSDISIVKRGRCGQRKLTYGVKRYAGSDILCTSGQSRHSMNSTNSLNPDISHCCEKIRVWKQTAVLLCVYGRLFNSQICSNVQALKIILRILLLRKLRCSKHNDESSMCGPINASCKLTYFKTKKSALSIE